MTKLYITCDLEGIWGVNTWRQCHPHTDPAGYARAVKQAARELGWLIDAAHQAGIDHITVNDAHEMMTNLSPEAFEAGRFPEGVHWLSGKPKVVAMMAGLDSRFDAYALVGYHAMAGTEAGTLCHTFHRKVAQVRINGVAYGEGGLNTLLAGFTHGVPLIFGAGDAAFVREMQPVFGHAQYVATKTGVSTCAAVHKPLEQLEADYRAALSQAFAQRDAWASWLPMADQPLEFPAWAPPYELEVQFVDTLCCDLASIIPWMTRVDGVTLRTHSQDFDKCYKAMQACYTILASAPSFDP